MERNEIRSDNSAELFPVVDENGVVVGKATRGECHGGSMLLHPVVHLHFIDTSGRLFLQLRPEWKDIQPGKWDTAVGGHVDFGETIEDALEREAREEIGICGFTARLLSRYVFQSARERELVHTFFTVSDTIPQPSAELAGGRFWSLRELKESMGKDVFTPNFESEFHLIEPVLEKMAKSGQDD